MTINNGDYPANPLTGDAYIDFSDAINMKGSYNPECQGLTKREAFAMAAMQNVMLNYNPWEQGDFDSSNYEAAAVQAVGLADALLKELSK
jgi:hypothetical protein